MKPPTVPLYGSASSGWNTYVHVPSSSCKAGNPKPSAYIEAEALSGHAQEFETAAIEAHKRWLCPRQGRLKRRHERVTCNDQQLQEHD